MSATIFDVLINKPQQQLGLFGNSRKQFVFFGVLSELMLFYFKPSSLFDKNGTPYCWSLICNQKNSVPVDVHLLSVFVGFVSVLIF